MLTAAVAVAVAAVLAWAGVAKLRAGDGPRGWAGLAPGATEVAVAIALLVPATRTPGGVGAAVLGTAFAAWMITARLRGVRRMACGCFGGRREHPVWLLAVRAGLLAVGGLVVATEVLDAVTLSTQSVLVVAVVALTAVVGGLAVMLLALYREVGVLQRRLGPRGPLEVDHEGPPVGTPAPHLVGLRGQGSELVVFASPGCRLCRELEPAIRAVERAGQRVVRVREDLQPDDCARYGVPGTPFLVHVVNGRVASKGLVNTLEQVEILLETGHERVAGGV